MKARLRGVRCPAGVASGRLPYMENTVAALEILLIEPDLSAAEMVEIHLKKAGLPYSVRRVASRDAYLQALEEFLPALVIAEYSIPRFDILEAIRTMKAESPGIPWIVISHMPGEDHAVAAMKAGASDYVNKKNLNQLAVAIRTLFGEQDESEGPADSEVTEEKVVTPAEDPPPVTPAGDTDLLFKQIVECSNDLIVVLDPDGKRYYANPAYAGVLDDPEALRGTDSFADVHPNDRDRIRELFRRTVETGRGERTEYRLMDEAGNARIIESQGSVISRAGRGVERVVVISRDVTARRRGEESLQNLVAGTSSVTGEKFFVALVRHMSRSLGVRFTLVSECVTIMRDRVRSLAYWANERWIPSFEYDVKDTTCEGVVREGRLCCYPERVQELFPRMEALKGMHAESYMGIPLFGTSEVPVGHLFIMDDKPLADTPRLKYILSLFAARATTELERMRTSKALKNAEIQFRSALEAIREGVIVTDLDDIITYTNPALQEMCGYPAKDMVGKLVFSLLLPEEDWQRSQARTEERLKGLKEEYDIRLKRKDGSIFPARITASPCYDDTHTVVGVIGVVSPLPA